jgi:tRNA A-37 threonylcarbamoyl transferase component Bud32
MDAADKALVDFPFAGVVADADEAVVAIAVLEEAVEATGEAAGGNLVGFFFYIVLSFS